MKHFSRSNLTPEQNALIEKYPLVFLERDEENYKWFRRDSPDAPESDYCNLRFGFELTEEFMPFVEDIAKYGELVVTIARETGHSDFFIHSCIVKEKLGRLEWQGHQHGDAVLMRKFYKFSSCVEDVAFMQINKQLPR